ncbi:MAG: hypothetical protein RIS09_80 [Actinomycetota bacterium]|jgi:hypothetical protein
MSWILWLLGVVVIAVFSLVAIGAFGQIADEEILDENVEYKPGMKLPLSVLGYRKDVVDRLLERAYNDNLRNKHD